MKTWKLSIAAVFVFPIAGGAQADDQATSRKIEEVVVAAPKSSQSLTEEVIAAAKSSPAMPAITIAIGGLKLSPPRIDAPSEKESE